MVRRMVVLHVEDSDDDVLFFARALEKLGSSARVERVHDGAQAQQYLKGEGKYEDRVQHPLPDAIVLDIRMAGVDGRSFATWLRREAQFEHIPCYVLADFDLSLDGTPIVEGANGIYGKPNDMQDWPGRVDDLMRSIDRAVARSQDEQR